MVYSFDERFDIGSGGIARKTIIQEIRRDFKFLSKSWVPSLSRVRKTEGKQNCKMNIKMCSFEFYVLKDDACQAHSTVPQALSSQ